MTEVVSIRFKSGGKSYFFDPGDIDLEAGESVIVETSKGMEFGECVKGNYMVNDDRIIPPLRPIIRRATEEDIELLKSNKEKEARAYEICAKKITEHGLDMKLVDVEYNFEGNKVLFFFIADGRVDFRELVKDLAAIFRTRIELRQIGVRDEAKMLGGLGICGRPFCCSQFMDEFQPVSIKMAKTQSLSLNPTKISGTCGRLMCCLKYEQDAYESLVKNAPKIDSYVSTPEGKGTIIDVNLLRQRVKVRYEGKSGDATISTFSMDEVDFIKTGKQHRADVAAGIEPEEKESPKELRNTTAPKEQSKEQKKHTKEPKTQKKTKEIKEQKEQKPKIHKNQRHKKPYASDHESKAADPQKPDNPENVKKPSSSPKKRLSSEKGGIKKHYTRRYPKGKQQSSGQQQSHSNDNQRD